MTKNIELKQIDGHFYGINNEKLKKGFFYCNRRRVFFDDEGDDAYCCEGDFSIIFSTQPIEGVPLLVLPSDEYEIEKLANLHGKEADNIGEDWNFNSFVAGYKVNQKQLNKAVELMSELTHRVESGDVKSKKTYAKFKEFIQSLTPIPVSVDVEYETHSVIGMTNIGTQAFLTEELKLTNGAVVPVKVYYK